MALRRGGSLLGGLLMGVSGGLRGYAQQEEMRKAEEAKKREEERQSTLDRMRIIELGGAEIPESGTVPIVPPMGGATIMAPVKPSPDRGGTVSFGGRSFFVPTAMERTRQAAQMERGMRERERESNNLIAYETLKRAFPRDTSASRPYTPVVDYGKEYERLKGIQDREANLRAQAQASRASGDAAREFNLQALRQQALGWWTTISSDPQLTQEDRNILGRQYSEISRMNPGMSDADIKVALMQGETMAGKQYGAQTQAEVRAEQARKLQEEMERRRTAAANAAGGGVPGAGPMAQAPANRRSPARPGGAPQMGATMPLQGETREQYWNRLVQGGMAPEAATQAAMTNIKD